MENGSNDGSPGTIRLGTTTDDERDCYGVQEDMLGGNLEDKIEGLQFSS